MSLKSNYDVIICTSVSYFIFFLKIGWCKAGSTNKRFKTTMSRQIWFEIQVKSLNHVCKNFSILFDISKLMTIDLSLFSKVGFSSLSIIFPTFFNVLFLHFVSWYQLFMKATKIWNSVRTMYPYLLLICTWFLKNQFVKIEFTLFQSEFLLPV